ncbi:hypothetical protein PPL_11148 [Heterostelium album PN500]|uniref:Tetratricopeptide repeat protein 1 n=1 Tax=Heterostelium pallidum (strain ATCC 26659 / Pp 5 / PN500) TaxID=670386 RepID=D3BTN8_HETP5|nr:hypothetical protein PPL_11148 [Heterostelium album PN500]EFA75074.1 hypothetical protein PPL_11148 [Heterostelium album PN500]|eukprot:XP_020427208.1 hypothetical protein PPL_11148 [Heterostelium album PN500]
MSDIDNNKVNTNCNTDNDTNDIGSQDQKNDNQNKDNDNKNTSKDEKKEIIKEKKIYKANKEDIEKANNLKAQGNMLYGATEYKEAIDIYTKAIELLTKPKKIVEIVDDQDEDHQESRSLCNEEVAVYHCNRAASHLALKQYDLVVSDCSESLELQPSNTIQMKSRHRRAQAYEATEKLTDALSDYKACLEIDPRFQPALQAAQRLPPIIKAKEDREREEMMSKLKDLGNTFLGKFGLSTDNFQFIKDPNSGGYSVNFKK